MKTIQILALITLTILFHWSFAQPGTLDLSFNPGSGPNSVINFNILSLTNSKFLINGQFNSYNGIPRNSIARLNSDGTLDLTFDPGLGLSVGNIVATAIQSDGKVIVGGDFTLYNGINRNGLARLHPDGSLDLSFTPATTADQNINTILIQPNGKIIFLGRNKNSPFLGVVGRLNIDGSLDSTFNAVGSGANSWINSGALQPDGKIVLGGRFTSYNGIVRNRIARINSDGSLDMSFDPGTGISGTDNILQVLTVVVQPDNKMILSGSFSYYNGISRNRIVRVHSDGTLDATFSPGIGANNWIYETITQPDGKYLIGGRFTKYNGITKNGIARLNIDGSLDTLFFSGIDSSLPVITLSIEPSGKIVIGGGFNTYQGVIRNFIARLNSDNTNTNTELDLSYTTSSFNGYEIRCNGTSDGIIDLTIDGGTPPYTFNWNNGAYTTEDLNGLPAGTYHVIVTDANSATAEETIILNQPLYPLAALGVPSFQGCNGENGGSIFLNAFGGIVPYTYNWNNGTYTTKHLSDLSAGSYTVVVTDANVCTTENTSNISPPDELFLEVTTDTFVFYGTSNPNECVTLNAAAQGGVPYIGPFGAELYLYTMAGNITLVSQTAEITVCPTSDTYYNIEATDQVGCTKTKTVFVKVYDISCGNNNDKIQVCINGSQTVCLTQNAANNVLANNPNAQLGSCQAYKTQELGSEEPIEFGISPNPTSGRFVISIRDTEAKASLIQVFGPQGNIVLSIPVAEYADGFQTELDLSYHADGVYFIKVQGENAVLHTEKIVKMH